MKIEIEVSEAVLREELQRQAAKMLLDKLGHWQLKDELTKVVNKLWGENVEKVVREGAGQPRRRCPPSGCRTQEHLIGVLRQ
jgi:hypothetical protein